MSEESGSFLSRWSKRKIESKELSNDTAQTTLPADSDAPNSTDQTEPPFDPKAFEIPIPDLDDIVAGFDMRPFMQKGVPESLKNAALRKLWHLDPAITDFVSPALDYAHDYNKAETIAGFGPLTSDHDLTDLLQNLFSNPDKISSAQHDNQALDVSETAALPETNQSHLPPIEHQTLPSPKVITHSENTIKVFPVTHEDPGNQTKTVQNEHPEQPSYPEKRDKKSHTTRHGSALPE